MDTNFKDRDNLELGIADYYTNQYSIEINQEKLIEQIVGFKGSLTATIKKNENKIIDIPIIWESEDEDIVIIDNEGNYELVGQVDEATNINCYIEGNEEVFDTITIKIVDTILQNKTLEITPKFKELKQNFEQEFSCNVYINGEKQTTKVTCVPNWEDSHYYTLEETSDGWKIKNIHSCQNKLELTFSGDDLSETMEIKLGGLF